MEELKNGTIIRIPTDKLSPSYEKLEYDPEVPPNLINSKVNVDTNENASAYLMSLMGSKIFDFPKPVSLIKYLMNFIIDKNDTILDFFSGSATTAHAVMELNKDGGNRKYICVQLEEKTDNEEFPTICEIGKERIRRAGAKITQEIASAKPRNDSNLDIGFRVLKLATTNFKEVYYHPSKLGQGDLLNFETNIEEGRTDLDLLFQIMLDLGIELSLKITPQTVDGTKLYMLENNELIACLEDNISQAAIEEIKKHKPYQVVLKDGCFADDNDKINALQELSNITTVSVI